MSKDDPSVRAYIALPSSVWQAVQSYRARVGAVTLAEAVRRLIEAGLNAEKERKDG